jgi:hypothetical protein
MGTPAVTASGLVPLPESKPAKESVVSALPGSTRQTLELGPGKPVPPFIQRSDNPYSAGRYPLARVYSVGDSFTLRLTDMLTGVVRSGAPNQIDYRAFIERVQYANQVA